MMHITATQTPDETDAIWKSKGINIHSTNKKKNANQNRFPVSDFFNVHKKMDDEILGPGYGAGIGCGVGVGFGLVGGIGIGDYPWNYFNLAFGVGLGCGVGVGFGFGQGFGYGNSLDYLKSHFAKRKADSNKKRTVVEN